MATPKRRSSKARTRSRRATWKVSPVNISECPRCHDPKLPHRVCSNCGHYDGKEVIAVSNS